MKGHNNQGRNGLFDCFDCGKLDKPNRLEHGLAIC